MVLVAERKHAQALEAAGIATQHFALLAGYEALTALKRPDEAAARLKQLLDARNYDLNAHARGVAVVRYGAGATSNRRDAPTGRQ
jgi:hypothetical protein